MGAGSGADIVSVSLADAGWMGGRKGIVLMGEVKGSQRQMRPPSSFVYSHLVHSNHLKAQFNSEKGGQGPRADLVELEIK